MESKMTHTPEPWHVGGVNDAIIYASDGFAVANTITHHGKHLSWCDVNARRIVACVNACSRFSTDHLENYPLVSEHGFSMYESVKAQRDEILAALKGMLEAFDHGTENEEWAKPFINAAHDAIAKCEVQS